MSLKLGILLFIVALLLWAISSSHSGHLLIGGLLLVAYCAIEAGAPRRSEESEAKPRSLWSRLWGAPTPPAVDED